MVVHVSDVVIHCFHIRVMFVGHGFDIILNVIKVIFCKLR